MVDLHPPQYPETFANDASQDSQVGESIFSSFPGGERHALLCHGSAASVIDLHPPGFTQTGANAVAGALQVGYGEGTATGGEQHALLWHGSAASVVDLNALLVGLGPTFVGSFAHDINDNGVIVGSAVAKVGDHYASYAVKWSPVPEPASVELARIAMIVIILLVSQSHTFCWTSRNTTPLMTHLACVGNSYHFSECEAAFPLRRKCVVKAKLWLAEQTSNSV